MVNGKTLLVSGCVGMVLALAQFSLYAVYMFSGFGFVMGLIGIIIAGINIYVGYEDR
jgi:hypothetical protein